MKLPDCYDPIYQEVIRDLRYTVRMARRPRCACCGEHIYTEQYLDLEPFGIRGYACEKCIFQNMEYTQDLEED